MSIRAVEVTVTLCALLIAAGCSNTTPDQQTHVEFDKTSPALQSIKTVNQQQEPDISLINLDNVRDIALEADTDGVERIAVSPNGKLVAVIGYGGPLDWLRVYSVSDGKIIYEFVPEDYGLVDVKWNPDGGSLAFYGATGEPMGREMHIDRGIGFTDIKTGKVKRFKNENLREDESIDWLPDGVHVISDNVVVDTQTGSQKGVRIGTSQPYGFNRSMTVSKDWMLAGESKRGVTEPPEIDILRAKPGQINSFAKVAELRAERNSATKAVTMFRTQPAFLDDGRLAYVKVFLKPDGVQEKVEIWTSKDVGKDEQAWIRLPRMGTGTGRFSTPPISWSSDGSILAYIEGSTLKVFKVDS